MAFERFLLRRQASFEIAKGLEQAAVKEICLGVPRVELQGSLERSAGADPIPFAEKHHPAERREAFSRQRD